MLVVTSMIYITAELEDSSYQSIFYTVFQWNGCSLFLEHVHSSSRNIPPSFNVRRSFTVRNTGPLPIYVDKMMIGNADCEGYGFKIIDCSSFDLPPNESHKIDIMLVTTSVLPGWDQMNV